MPEPRYWLTDVSRMESIYGFSIPDQISFQIKSLQGW